MKYDIFIDGSFILKKNKAQAQRFSQDGKIYSGLLVKMFFSSVFKELREIEEAGYEVGRVVIGWDAKPYHKEEILKDEYKADRKYATEEDLKDPEISDEKKNKIQLEINNWKQEKAAKAELITGRAGEFLRTLSYRGAEADDLAYYWSRVLNDYEGVATMFVTSDNDYFFFVQENDIFKKIFRSKTQWFDYAKVREHEKVADTETLMEHVSMIQAGKGNHNNLKNIMARGKKSMNNQDFIKAIKEGNYEFVSDEELYKKQLSIFDLDNFPFVDDLKGKIITLRSKTAEFRKPDLDFENYLRSLKITTGIRTLVNNYSKFKMKL